MTLSRTRPSGPVRPGEVRDSGTGPMNVNPGHSRVGRILAGPHTVIAGVVLDLGQAQRFHDRRDVVAEPAAEPLLQAVPATNRAVRRARTGFDGAARRRLLLVGVTQRHPVA